LLKPSRTYFHIYKKGFLNSQAVRMRVKHVIFSMPVMIIKVKLMFLLSKSSGP
jgi:hypothetical protein